MKKNIKGKNLVPVTIVDLNLDDTPDLNSTDPVTSRGVADAINKSAGSIKALIPEGTTAENPLVNASGIANKADANKVVSIADAYVTHGAQTGDKWFKVAESSSTIANTSITGLWNVYAKSPSGDFTTGQVRLTYSIGSIGNAPVLKEFSLISDSWNLINNNIKVVCRGLSGNITIEIWINTRIDYSGFVISELQSGVSWRTQTEKIFWTYTSYVNSGGESVPVTDIYNNVAVTDITVIILQTGITSPKKDNFVSMNENGLVKNSGINIDVFTDGNGDQMTETPPKQVYVVGKFYFVNGKICRCTAYSASSATFDVYGVVEAMNYILSQI